MNKSKIKFSIVIPVYNASEFLRDTLNSIRSQSYTNYEVLVTNDGSTDSTEEVLKKYKEENLKFPLDFATQDNKGVSTARNNAIFRAIGDYIAFLDQDDWWFPEKLKKVVQVLNVNTEIDVLYHRAIAIGWKRRETIFKSGHLKVPAFADLLLNGNRIGLSTAIVKLDKVKEVGGFCKDLYYSEDYDFWLKLANKNTSFYYIPDVLSKYIWHQESMSNKVEYMIQEKLAILEHHFNILRKKKSYNDDYLTKKYKRRKSIYLFGSSRRFYYLNDYKKAVDYSIKAIKTDYKFWKPYLGLLLSYFKSKIC